MQPRMLALKTAVPPYILDQSDIAGHAARLFSGRKDIGRLMPMFANTGIEKRHASAPVDWYLVPRGWTDRGEVYLAQSVALLEEVARACIAQAGLTRENIDAIVVASTTGIATPSLDALLVEKMQLRRDIQRLPIFGLGCAGGVIGLARAAALAKAQPGTRVLFLVVELCTLTFRKDDLSKSNIVATALFADGAAGAILSTQGDGPAIAAWGEHTWPSSLDIMGWDVTEEGLKARFSQSIPMLTANEFPTVLQDFLKARDLKLSDIDGFACHPGGAKVLDALEVAFGLPSGGLVDSRAVLRDYGNMSAATAMFVLARMDWRARNKRTLMSALGPGFSAAFLILEG